MSYLYRTKKFIYTNKAHREFDQFFVWKDKNIYIMDNHRAALWCWLKEVDIKSNNKLSFLHIDNHTDMTPRGLHCTCSKQINFNNLSINKYLQAKHTCNQITGYATDEIFSYDNFLRFFIEQYPTIISPQNVYITLPQGKYNRKADKKILSILKKYALSNTHASAKQDCLDFVKRIDQKELLNHFKSNKNSNWIIDLDLDYFLNEDTNKFNFNLAVQVFQLIKTWYDQNRIIALTVAWSPEFLIDRNTQKITLGLKRAKKLNNKFCEVFNLNCKPI